MALTLSTKMAARRTGLRSGTHYIEAPESYN